MQIRKKISFFVCCMFILFTFFGCTVSFEINPDGSFLDELSLEKNVINTQFHFKKPIFIRIKSIKPHQNNGDITLYLKGEDTPCKLITYKINTSKRSLEITSIDPQFFTIQSNGEYLNFCELDIKANAKTLTSLKINFTENREALEQTTEQVANILKTIKPTTQSLKSDNLANLDFDVKYITKELYEKTETIINEANELLKVKFSQAKADKVTKQLEQSIVAIKNEVVKGKRQIVMSTPFAYIILGLFVVCVVVMLLSLFLTFNLKLTPLKWRKK